MRIGVEVEFTGVDRRTIAEGMMENTYFKECKNVVHMVQGAERIRIQLTDILDRKWYLVLDRSITPVFPDGVDILDECEYMCELVTPVLDGNRDIQIFLRLLNLIREEDGVTNDTCGVHIHFDCPKTIAELKRIFNRYLKIESSLPTRFGIPKYRSEKYAKAYPKEFVDEYKDIEYSLDSISAFQDFLYDKLGNGVSRDDDKNPVRYYMLNFDSIHKRGTIEFRVFNSTLGEDVMLEYIDWANNLLLD